MRLGVHRVEDTVIGPYITIDDADEGYVIVELDQLSDLIADLTAERTK